MEHFATLFDRNFLPQGLALLQSLQRTASRPFRLWVLCLDQDTYSILHGLRRDDLELLRLEDCETPELRRARANRSYGEYCWTLGCHLFSFVFDRNPEVRRLTYLDADMYFLSDPTTCLQELESSGKSVLITEHAFAPAWAHYAKTAGTYCVQYVTFTRTGAALQLLATWQTQTRAQCSSDPGKGGYGDQAYLDEWPTSHSDIVHVLDHRYRTLAPWNSDFAAGLGSGTPPLFYHFHGLRILGRRCVLLAAGYPLNQARTKAIYDQYLAELRAALALIKKGTPGYRVKQSPLSFVGWLKLGWGAVCNRLVLRRRLLY
jgi:hypothetical protein